MAGQAAALHRVDALAVRCRVRVRTLLRRGGGWLWLGLGCNGDSREEAWRPHGSQAAPGMADSGDRGLCDAGADAGLCDR